MIIGNVLLLNVVVAVLLDEFIANVVREKEAADKVSNICAQHTDTHNMNIQTHNAHTFRVVS